MFSNNEFPILVRLDPLLIYTWILLKHNHLLIWLPMFWSLEGNKYKLFPIRNIFYVDFVFAVFNFTKSKITYNEKKLGTHMHSLRQKNLREGIPPDSFLESRTGSKNTLHGLFQISERLSRLIRNKKTAARTFRPRLGTTDGSTVAGALQSTTALPALLLYRLTQPHPIITLHCSIRVLCPLNCSHLGWIKEWWTACLMRPTSFKTCRRVKSPSCQDICDHEHRKKKSCHQLKACLGVQLPDCDWSGPSHPNSTGTLL